MRMTLPHAFVPTRWARRITGHQGFTYLFWTFVDLRRDEIDIAQHDGFKRHEYRHAWPLAYWAVSIVWKLRTGRGYTDNFFERDARRYEERTR